MGGSSKNSSPATPAAAPAPTQPMQTIQPAMPGQLDALSQQLAMGFGQSQPDMLAYIQQFYKPMQVPDFSKGFVPPTNGSATTPVTSGKQGRQGSGSSAVVNNTGLGRR